MGAVLCYGPFLGILYNKDYTTIGPKRDHNLEQPPHRYSTLLMCWDRDRVSLPSPHPSSCNSLTMAPVSAFILLNTFDTSNPSAPKNRLLASTPPCRMPDSRLAKPLNKLAHEKTKAMPLWNLRRSPGTSLVPMWNQEVPQGIADKTHLSRRGNLL